MPLWLSKPDQGDYKAYKVSLMRDLVHKHHCSFLKEVMAKDSGSSFHAGHPNMHISISSDSHFHVEHCPWSLSWSNSLTFKNFSAFLKAFLLLTILLSWVQKHMSFLLSILWNETLAQCYSIQGNGALRSQHLWFWHFLALFLFFF